MTKKQKNVSTGIHDLVVFKGRMAQGTKQEDIQIATPIQDIDQENKIKLSSEIVPFGAVYRFSILIVNESMAPITEIKTRIKYSNLLSLTRHYPPVLKISPPKIESGVKVINFEIDRLNENSKQQINFYFDPLIINVKIETSASTSYINNKGFIRALNLKPIEIKIVPITIGPKIIPSSQVRDFLNIEGIKKGIKSHGIGRMGKADLALYFSHIEQLLKMHNFQLVTKDEKNRIAWFFGMDLDTHLNILVIGQVISNKVEFLAASKNPSILIAVLTKLSNDFKTSISSTGLVSVDQIYNLECKNCGNVLPSFPAKGDAVECQNCHIKQVVW